MKIRELLEHMENSDKIHVVGHYKHGLTDLYVGTTDILKEIIRVGDTLEDNQWGTINPEWCFLKRDVKSICNGNSTKGLFVTVQMPDSYEHVDINGKKLEPTIQIKSIN